MELIEFVSSATVAIIAVLAGFLFTRWHDNREEIQVRKFFANMFFLEIKKLNFFIGEIHEFVDKKSFLSSTKNLNEYGERYDNSLEERLIIYFKKNPHYRITQGSDFITDKNPFELFYSKIYLFENENLINNLVSIERLLTDANSCLVDYFNNKRKNEKYIDLQIFLVNIDEIKILTSKILSEKNLEKIL